MNRRQFIQLVSLVALSGVTLKLLAQTAQKPKPRAQSKAAYQRELSKRVYPKIKAIALPLETVVLTFQPKGAKWQPTIIERRPLRPVLGSDGILIWT